MEGTQAACSSSYGEDCACNNEGQCEHDVSAVGLKKSRINSQFQELQMFKDLPGERGQHGVLGQVSEEENKKETDIRNFTSK